jgi:hypothetical protein
LFYNHLVPTKVDVMTLHELEQTISKLPPAELLKFREWFLRFDGDRWDEQIEKDATSGKLDSLAQAALRAFRSGQTNPL